MKMRYWTHEDLKFVQSFLPTDVTAEIDEISELDEGDFFGIVIRRYGASVYLHLEKSTEAAFKAKMPLIYVEEDRYESRWREKFGTFDNAIRRAVELVRDPSKMQALLETAK
jgi:hypothetical protein